MLKVYTNSIINKKNQLILSNGSERGDYIPMDYVFSRFNKIHDGIQLFKTYYPYDECWNDQDKISSSTLKKDVDYAWDYEYEDYHPFDVFSENSKTLRQFEEIKQYGSDIHLTLTMDITLQDNDLIAIVNVLKNYGRIYLRINHEANGSWFRYHKYHSYKEVSDFFVKFHRIIKSHSSNIFTVFNLTADVFVSDQVVLDTYLHLSQDELKEALAIADYWSIDKYVSLNWGWPFHEMDSGEYPKYWTFDTATWWRLVEETYIKMICHNDMKAKKIFITEFNSDSDVDGYKKQAKIVGDVYSRLLKGDYDWIEGVMLYQFRDFGGLGLEKGDIDTFEVLPAFHTYRKVLKKFNYTIDKSKTEYTLNDYTFRWLDSDTIHGLTIELPDTGKRFKNLFDMPVFIMTGPGQKTIRVECNTDVTLDKGKSFNLFIPPFIKDNALRFTVMMRDIKEKLATMIS